MNGKPLKRLYTDGATVCQKQNFNFQSGILETFSIQTIFFFGFTHCPIFKFDKIETYFPSSINFYLSRCELYYDNQKLADRGELTKANFYQMLVKAHKQWYVRDMETIFLAKGFRCSSPKSQWYTRIGLLLYYQSRLYVTFQTRCWSWS